MSKLIPPVQSVFYGSQDIIALVVQGVGGGIASESGGQNSQSQANLAETSSCGAITKLSDWLNVRTWHDRGAHCSHRSWRHRLPASVHHRVLFRVIGGQVPCLVHAGPPSATIGLHVLWGFSGQDERVSGTLDRILQAMLITTTFLLIFFLHAIAS